MRSVIVLQKSLLRALVFAVAAGMPSAARAQQPVVEQTSPKIVQELSASFRAAVDRVRPSIVFIETNRGPRELEEWGRRNSPDGPVQRDGVPEIDSGNARLDDFGDRSGTGILFDPRGYVLTCCHIVESADTVFVRLADGRRIESVKVLTDPLTDLAVVQISETGSLRTATLGDSDQLQVSDWVVSIGNPYSLGLSVSAGIVSGIDRQSPLAPRTPLIQTDAASNPGNSGGALINLEGQVVGISESGYGAHEGFQGIGFAVPINVAKRVAQQLIEHGRVPRLTLGCDTQQVSSDIASQLGIKQSSGLIVTDVKLRSSAAEAGLLVGDVITHFNGTKISNNLQFLRMLERAAVDSDITFRVVRDGRKLEIIVEPEERTEDRRAASRTKSETDEHAFGYHDVPIGLTIDQLSPQLASNLGYSEPVEGVVIAHVESKGLAAKEGILAGMVVRRINNAPIQSIEDYQRVTEKQSLDRGFLMLISTPRRKHFIVLRK